VKWLTAQRLKLLTEKLKTMKTSGGTRPELLLYYVPTPLFNNDQLCSFWKEISDQYHFKFMDLTNAYNAFKVEWYPTNLMHYTIYGNELVAQILSHYFIENKVIPF
jgi:hypothetical protein